MKVNLSKYAGFCLGVRRAINIALKSAGCNTNIFMLGDIVHNEFVVKRVQEQGVKKIKKLARGKGKILLIRAHGAPLSVYNAAEKAGYKIIDATCPMVKEIHQLAKNDEKKGYTVIIIGDNKHEEVLGIKGSLRHDPIIIDPKKPLPLKKLRNIEKASIVVQSTQNTDTVIKIVNKISKIVKDVHFHDTICNPTKKRQQDAKTMPLKNDAIVIIGSKTSANTKRLYEIAKSLNKKTFWIGSVKELKPDIFKNLKSVGVLAGASTPDETIQQVVSFLHSL